jgi:thioesterase domain-containing protein
VWARREEDIEDVVARVVNVTINNVHLAQNFQPGRFDGDILFFSATLDKPDVSPTSKMWAPYVAGKIENHSIDCRHEDMLQPMPLAKIGRILAAKLAAFASTCVEHP